MRIPSFRVWAALGVLTLITGCSREPSSREVRAWDAEIQRLQAEQDSLRLIAANLVKNDPRIQALPKGDAVISVPTAFIRTLIQRVFDDVASHVTLRLSGIKAHVAKKIKKVVTIGEFVVDVDVEEVVGKLRPQQPDISFAGQQISMSLPVEVHEGYGKAKIHFVWNGKNVADLTCGDLDVTQRVSGNVIPSRYVVSGRLNLSMRGNHVICSPQFPETKVRIRVVPSKQSWNAIDSLLAEKHGMCGWVLDKVDVRSILRNVVEEKGFNVKLPLAKIKPFVIPAGIKDSVTVGSKAISVETTSNTIRIDPDAILYSATVTLK